MRRRFPGGEGLRAQRSLDRLLKKFNVLSVGPDILALPFPVSLAGETGDTIGTPIAPTGGSQTKTRRSHRSLHSGEYVNGF